MVFMIESQVAYVLDGIKKMRRERVKSVEVKADAQVDYNKMLGERFKNTVWITGGCMSWYHTASGKNTTLWPGFSFQFRKQTKYFEFSAYNVSKT
jgi:hypothetical protein